MSALPQTAVVVQARPYRIVLRDRPENLAAQHLADTPSTRQLQQQEYTLQRSYQLVKSMLYIATLAMIGTTASLFIEPAHRFDGRIFFIYACFLTSLWMFYKLVDYRRTTEEIGASLFPKSGTVALCIAPDESPFSELLAVPRTWERLCSKGKIQPDSNLIAMVKYAHFFRSDQQARAIVCDMQIKSLVRQSVESGLEYASYTKPTSAQLTQALRDKAQALCNFITKQHSTPSTTPATPKGA